MTNFTSIQANPGIASRHPKLPGEAAHDYANRLYAAGQTERMAKLAALSLPLAPKVGAPPAHTGRRAAIPSSDPVARPAYSPPPASAFSSFLPSLDGTYPASITSREGLIAAELADVRPGSTSLDLDAGISAEKSNEMWDEVIKEVNTKR